MFINVDRLQPFRLQCVHSAHREQAEPVVVRKSMKAGSQTTAQYIQSEKPKILKRIDNESNATYQITA